MYKVVVTIITLLITLPLLAQKADYRNNVVRKGNRVYLDGFKTLKQKGNTCNVFSTVMVLRYYGYPVHSKELMRGVTHEIYSNQDYTKKYLKEKGYILSTFAPITSDIMEEKIRAAIDSGIPVVWIRNLALSPKEEERPKVSPGVPAPHASIITGYDLGGTRIAQIIYADSWGTGQLNKMILFSDAVKMTTHLTVIYPKYLDPVTIAQIDPPLNQNPKQAVPPPKRKKLPASTASSSSNRY